VSNKAIKTDAEWRQEVTRKRHRGVRHRMNGTAFELTPQKTR
jgi:hypothetical protein